MMTTRRSAAVLGAGIMGCCTALYLARHGFRVVLFDQEAAPFSGASRWNEGKIHLGYLYSAAPSVDTAHRVQAGGLLFKPLVEDLIGQSISSVTTPTDDIYLIHRESVVSPEVSRAYLDTVAAMVRDHPDSSRYLVDARGSEVTTLGAAELEAMADPAVIAAGYRVLERSVSTRWIADAFVSAVTADPRITLAMTERVVDVTSTSQTGDGPWQVQSIRERTGPFDYVVNALWHGRPALDRRVGLRPDRLMHHRYRVALFVRTARPVVAPSAVVAVGPYGDMKDYNGREFYLSWYPTGMLVEAEGVEHPEPPTLDTRRREAIARDTFSRLSEILPAAARVRAAAEDITVQGGWVYAQASGSLSDPLSSLHRRDHLGISWYGTYVSVDTGKYSVAPLLAKTIAQRIAG